MELTYFKTEYDIYIDIVEGDNHDNHTNKTDPTYSILNNYWKPKISLYDGIKDIIQKNIHKYNT